MGMLVCLQLPQQHMLPALKSSQEERGEEGNRHPVGARGVLTLLPLHSCGPTARMYGR